jgi:hypothetical protein
MLSLINHNTNGLRQPRPNRLLRSSNTTPHLDIQLVLELQLITNTRLETNLTLKNKPFTSPLIWLFAIWNVLNFFILDSERGCLSNADRAPMQPPGSHGDHQNERGARVQPPGTSCDEYQRRRPRGGRKRIGRALGSASPPVAKRNTPPLPSLPQSWSTSSAGKTPCTPIGQQHVHGFHRFTATT